MVDSLFYNKISYDNNNNEMFICLLGYVGHLKQIKYTKMIQEKPEQLVGEGLVHISIE